MILNKIDDPRDPLAKATRHELQAFAKSIGHFDFNFNGVQCRADLAPANITRAYLRSIGKTNIRTNAPPLGASARAPETTATNVPQVSADADLARQFASQMEPEPEQRPKTIGELRSECKRLGIKLDRRDNMNTMREKIEAATNGKNAA